MTARTEYDRSELVSLLSATIGHEPATRVVGHAAHSLGFERPRLTREEALATLEHIATEPGLIGITARLAKSRLRARSVAELARSG